MEESDVHPFLSQPEQRENEKISLKRTDHKDEEFRQALRRVQEVKNHHHVLGSLLDRFPNSQYRNLKWVLGRNWYKYNLDAIGQLSREFVINHTRIIEMTTIRAKSK